MYFSLLIHSFRRRPFSYIILKNNFRNCLTYAIFCYIFNRRFIKKAIFTSLPMFIRKTNRRIGAISKKVM